MQKQLAVVLLVLLCIGWCIPTKGQVYEPPGAPDAAVPSGANRVSEYAFKTFPYRLYQGFKASFLRLDSLAWLGLAGGAAIGLQGPDADIQTFFREERPFETGKEVGNTLGNLGVMFGLSGLTFGVGALVGVSALSETGVMMFEALAITAPVTTLLKVGVRRRRPDGSNTLSFPSMHASGTFALATVTMRQHGILAGIPAYLAATWVAMARMQKDKHFFSDTLFGAVLGTVIGNAVVHVHRREEKGARLTFLPVACADTFGIRIAGRF